MRPPVPVLYEDNHVLAVDKPPRMLCAPDRTRDPSLLELCRQWRAVAQAKPGRAFLGLVHRLDRPVGGVMVFAKTSKAAGRLSAAFAGRLVDKRYLAVVEGVAPEIPQRVDAPLRKDPRTGTVGVHPEGKRAVTFVRRLAVSDNRSLVAVRIVTGVAHQIRAHLAYLGHPVLFDTRYGAPVRRHPLPGAVALHAVQLCFPHPVRGKRVCLRSAPGPWWPGPVAWRQLDEAVAWFADIASDASPGDHDPM